MSYTQEQLAGMSDSEIELRVSHIMGLAWRGQLKYCTDWSLTGPLMVENSMRLERIGHIWYAERFVSCSGARYIASSENPLRAVCEVILMMEKA